MHAVCRWILIGLLVLTLPLRGLAAGQLGCGAGHAAMGQAVHAQEAAEPALLAPPPEPSGSQAKDDGGAAGNAAKCTQCAPCCGAVAPPLESAVLHVHTEASEIKAAVPAMSLRSGSNRLERPPRVERA
ncbi:MAG: hypothetical protein ACK4F7_03830 [Inhella sp.]